MRSNPSFRNHPQYGACASIIGRLERYNDSGRHSSCESGRSFEQSEAVSLLSSSEIRCMIKRPSSVDEQSRGEGGHTSARSKASGMATAEERTRLSRETPRHRQSVGTVASIIAAALPELSFQMPTAPKKTNIMWSIMRQAKNQTGRVSTRRKKKFLKVRGSQYLRRLTCHSSLHAPLRIVAYLPHDTLEVCCAAFARIIDCCWMFAILSNFSAKLLIYVVT